MQCIHSCGPTRKDCNIISDCTVSDFISDHWALHASLQKQIAVKALHQIKDDALAEDLDRFNVDQGCVDVDIMIEQYDKYLSNLLNKHAPKKNIYVVDIVDGPPVLTGCAYVRSNKSTF